MTHNAHVSLELFKEEMQKGNIGEAKSICDEAQKEKEAWSGSVFIMRHELEKTELSDNEDNQ